MRKLLLLFLLLSPSALYSQSVRYQNIALGSRGNPLANQNVSVCTQPTNTTTQPCSPLATLATSTSTTSGGTNPLTTDSNGNFFFYAAPGRYTVQIYGPQVSAQFVQPDTVLACDPTGSCTLSGTLIFTNHNNVCWAGPGATPTIDQAITLCQSYGTPVFITISPNYSGPESALLTTTSVGYKVFAGANNVTIEDLRQADSGVGNPTGTPMYPITYGGRSDGELTRESVNYWCATPTDSCVGLADYVWFQGTFPTNGGAIMGSSHLAVLHDAVTVGTSSPVSPTVGSDFEMWLDATSVDRPVPYAQAASAGVVINRANSLNRTTIGTAYHAQKLNDIVGGLVNTAYAFDAEAQTGGAQANYGFHTYDGILGEINSVYDFTDAGNAVTTTSMVTTTATYNTTGVCLFTTGQRVAISGTATVLGGSYNGVYVVLTPGCSGGSSFTVTLPFSGLGASSGGVARGLHSWTKFQSSDSSITHFPMLDSAGEKWKRNSDSAVVAQINANGIFALGSLSCTGSATCFAGGFNNELAGVIAKEGSAPGGIANDMSFQPTSADHMASFIENNAGGVQHWPSTVVLHSAYTNATTTFSTLSDGTRTASFAVAANVDYTLTCDITYNPSATTAGPKIQITGPSTPTAVNISVQGATNATAYADGSAAAFATPITAFGTSGAAPLNLVLRITAGISNGANAGTVALQLAANGAGTLTVNAGSACRIQ